MGPTQSFNYQLKDLEFFLHVEVLLEQCISLTGAQALICVVGILLAAQSFPSKLKFESSSLESITYFNFV